MKISKLRSLTAGNRYARTPVLLIWLSIDETEKLPDAGMVRSAVPSLAGVVASSPLLTEGPVSRLGEPAAQLAAVVLQELMKEASFEPDWYHPMEPLSPGEIILALDNYQRHVTANAALLAVRFVNSLLSHAKSTSPAILDLPEYRRQFLEGSKNHLPSIDMRYMIDQFRARGHPAHHVAGRNLIVGHGIRQRWMNRQTTDSLSAWSDRITTNKAATNLLLRQYALPVTHPATASSAEQAVKLAREKGFPLVVKPANTDGGVGVHLDIQDFAATHRAATEALTHADTILIEEYIQGSEHRLLVINGELVAATRNHPPSIMGDGSHTLEQLVALENADPRRLPGHRGSLSPVIWTSETTEFVGAQGYNNKSLVPAGTRVFLSNLGNVARGGTSEDVTDEVHPDNRQLAETAALAARTDIAGIDFVTSDIGRSWREAGGAIIEVNITPGLRIHFAPAQGSERDVAKPILELLFPDQLPSRIPVAIITGSNGTTITTHMVSQIVTAAGQLVGSVNTEGMFVGEDCLEQGDYSGGDAVERLLLNPRVEVAVLEIAGKTLLKSGAGLQQCDVATLLNVADEDLGNQGIETVDQLAAVKGGLLELADKAVVINADDARCLAQQARAGQTEIILFSAVPANTAFDDHTDTGGRGLRLTELDQRDCIEYIENGKPVHLMFVDEIPAARQGQARHNSVNALAAAATAVGMGISLQTIRRGLQGFHSNSSDN